ncbi:peptide-methionine (S)-S-oxide reductase MsrA [Corynebacterium kroppenstedtii]|uniref:peptide-methionine (S)-S-oxide reductase MsrA n=1 Tax=Corynebacterium sp. PCR 32 TaxID=3351342 RepID=UPI003097065C
MGFLFDAQPTPTHLVSKDDALVGRKESIVPVPSAHTVTGAPIDGPWPDGLHSIVLGLGCFWGAEKLFWTMDGVWSTAVGYAGGYTPNPTYREVCTGKTGHAETVRVIYDPATLPYAQLIRAFFEAHDPTQGFRQGNDVGTQYRSVIYAENEDDVRAAREIAESFAHRLAAAGYGDMTTEISLLSDTPTGMMYLAEDEHQQYLAKNPGGYCPVHSTGVECQ